MRNVGFTGLEANETYNPTRGINYAWEFIRYQIIVPLLQIALYICIGMSIMLFFERVYMAIIIVCVKCLGKKRYTAYQLEAIKQDLEKNKNYPMVLVQIPMYNEKEALVELECQKWIRSGVNIKYETRNNRNGYKAGALREGLKKSYVEACEFVVIFDADFQPEKDFLWRTIPYLLENPELGLVQARWKFGTAGVWRMTALIDAGGWKDRTTVEDMDLAVRASLKGWKFLFVGDLARVSIWKKWHVIYAFFFVRKIVAHWVTFFFYCIVIPTTILIPEVHLPKPLAIYLPAAITILNAVSTLRHVNSNKENGNIYHFNCLSWTYSQSYCSLCHRSIHLLVLWILFENVMSLHRTKAAIIGLLEANRVNEWVVTEKLGNTARKNNPRAVMRPRSRIGERIHFTELTLGMFLLHCAIYNMLYGNDHFYVYLLLQAAAFFVVGVGYVGTIVPN
ncbi:mannan synthase 1-like [Dorcoceras hygrometricum]|uniref:Mannan synthase 1-like n=1 Tax=Dorcoceras hygrometricum TaxID=472368 RepID=A0A2Z7B9A7_9LAMI|nr:mannan synthase 1-like [Dorcoceras hygrometricum]